MEDSCKDWRLTKLSRLNNIGMTRKDPGFTSLTNTTTTAAGTSCREYNTRWKMSDWWSTPPAEGNKKQKAESVSNARLVGSSLCSHKRPHTSFVFFSTEVPTRTCKQNQMCLQKSAPQSIKVYTRTDWPCCSCWAVQCAAAIYSGIGDTRSEICRQPTHVHLPVCGYCVVIQGPEFIDGPFIVCPQLEKSHVEIAGKNRSVLWNQLILMATNCI